MKNLLDECISDAIQQTKQEIKESEFKKSFCVFCRNPECVNAKWAMDKFSARVMTQEDRLLNPIQADPRDPKYAGIKSFVEVSPTTVISSQNWDAPVVAASPATVAKTPITKLPNSRNTKRPIVDKPAYDPWAVKPQPNKVTFGSDGKIKE